jgi:hypothetical protein
MSFEPISQMPRDHIVFGGIVGRPLQEWMAVI